MISPYEAIEILESLGLTQQQIAELTGTQQGYISRLKNKSIKRPSYQLTDKLRLLVKKMKSENGAS